MIRLNKRQVLLLHEQLIDQTGGTQGVRDEGLLESALAAPFQSFGGNDLYPTIIEKGAHLGYGLVKNHPFIDGNKRIGTHVMLMFFVVNGIPLHYTQEELADTILHLAASEISCSDLIDWIKAHT